MISQAQKQFLAEEGYVVIPEVIPHEVCDAVIQTIMAYTGVDLDDPDSWYLNSSEGHGIVPLHHDQALWNLRQIPAVHQIFASLYGTESLWVSVDRVSYKPPWSASMTEWTQAPVHWDCDPWQTNELSYQGVVYLTDTSADQGAFACVPSIYKSLESYCIQHEADEHRRSPQVADNDLLPVEGSRGSLVVFNRLMPHTSVINRSLDHRFVQYVTMQPAGTEQARQKLADQFLNGMPPQWAINQQIKDQQIPEPGPVPRLSSLGRKLAGLDRWS